MAAAGVRDRCTLLLHDQSVGRDTADLQRGQLFGADRARLQDVIATADLLWNFANALKNPLLAQFRRRVLVDLDPGVLQISAESWDMGQDSHDVFLTVGTKLHDPDCKVPTIDRTWHRFVPPVYLPMWPVQPDPGPAAPFSTVTQWNWDELGADPALSLSKRHAFLRYLTLPGGPAAASSSPPTSIPTTTPVTASCYGTTTGGSFTLTRSPDRQRPIAATSPRRVPSCRVRSRFSGRSVPAG